MEKKSNDGAGTELIILLLMGLLAYDLVFGNTVMNAGHQMLQRGGISQKIEKFESELHK